MVVYLRILAAATSVLLAPLYLAASVRAQQPEPSRSPPDAPAAAHVGDEYRLVFPTSCFGTAKMVKSEDDTVRASKFDSFVEQLSKAGAEGYRLTSFAYVQSGLPLGVVRRASARYEYTWVAFRGGYEWLRGRSGFMQMFVELSQKGFHLADHAYFILYCEPVLTDDSSLGSGATGRSCETIHIFLLEREVEAKKPVRFAVLGWEEKPYVPAVVQFKRRLSEGLVPKQVFPGYDIWFEEGDAGDVSWGDAEIEMVWYDPSWWGSDTKKSVNKVAKRGYRIGLINWDTAVMYRRPGTAGFSYVWLKAKKKDFEKQLARLQAKGAVYLRTYEKEDELIFEHRLAGDGPRREYKALKFEFSFEEVAGDTRVRINLAAPGNEAPSTLRSLVRNGFAVRDVFYAKVPGVILERPL